MNQAHPEPSMPARVKLPRCSCDASSRSAPDECKDFAADGIHRVPTGCFDVAAEQGSAQEGRRLNQQASPRVTARTSSRSVPTPGWVQAASASSSLAGTSSTWLLISPEATYRV
jgi:hypothetical protein